MWDLQRPGSGPVVDGVRKSHILGLKPLDETVTTSVKWPGFDSRRGLLGSDWEAVNAG